ncbi:hypothetical protein E4U58_004627 [Claviceps cyperi]|nr:hypothetical protein E4U58_004627 [Claviceps cyperi]
MDSSPLRRCSTCKKERPAAEIPMRNVRPSARPPSVPGSSSDDRFMWRVSQNPVTTANLNGPEIRDNPEPGQY